MGGMGYWDYYRGPEGLSQGSNPPIPYEDTREKISLWRMRREGCFGV